MKGKAIVYIRTSHPSQTQGFSLETQESKCRAYAEYNDMEVTHISRDESISGKTIDKRPGIQEALSLLGEGDTLIVYSMSRASRSVKDMIYILDIIKGKKAHFASATEKIDTSGAIGTLLFHIFAAIAQFESMQTGERVSHNMQMRKETLGTANNRARYGYKYVNHKVENKTVKVELVKNEEEQKVLTIIKDMRLTPFGNSSRTPYKRIADYLTNQGIPTKYKKTKWHAQTVKDILIAEGIEKRMKKYPLDEDPLE